MLKRSYSTSSSYVPTKRGRYPPKARRIPRAPRASGVSLVKRTVSYDHSFNVDAAYGFGFSPTYLWVNGSATTAIVSASDITNLYDCVRVKYVDVIITPFCNVHEYAVDTATTGIRNIPILYMAEDKTDSSVPNINTLLQEDTLKVDMLDKVIRHRCYPRINTGSDTINLSYGKQWIVAGSDIPANGIKMYIDTINAQTYAGVRFNFIITYECKDAR